MSSRYRLKLENFRAIKKADIKLNGITVLTGENGCGKSTISKFLYHFIYINNNLDSIINEDYLYFMRTLDGSIFRVYRDLNFRYNKDIKKFEYVFNQKINPYQEKSVLLKKIQTLKYIIEKKNVNIKFGGLFRELKYFGERYFKDEYFDNIKDDPIKVLEKLSEIIEKVDKERENKIKHRKEKIIKNKILSIISGAFDNFNYDLQVDGISVKKGDSIEKIENINATFIESPMVLSNSDDEYDTKFKITYENTNVDNTLKKIDELFTSKEILDGDVALDDFSGEPYYTKNGDETYDLEECATGVKSISILYMLYKNGHLDRDTILILDEPECHLHPQWVVEYARLIIMLHKLLGVTFLIASHNPRMIEAIDEISHKEKILDSVNFYLAEKEKNGIKYTFNHLKENIQAIYKSFNLSFDRIDTYAAIKDTEDEKD